MLNSRHIRPFAVALAAAVTTSSAQAAFTPIDTFEGRTLGDIGGQNGWVSNSTTYDVALDPAGGLNQVLQLGAPGANTASIYKPLTLPEGQTGTLFFRLRRDNNWNASIGMTDVATPAVGNFPDFESQLNFNRGETGNPPWTRFNNAGSFVQIDTVAQNSQQDFDVATNVWYSFWVVINNATNRSEAYVSTNGGSTATKLIGETNSLADFGYRNGTTNTSDLVNFLIVIANSQSGNAYVDDIYFDGTGANLSNPIPEPSVLGLGGLGALGLLAARRRRRTPQVG